MKELLKEIQGQISELQAERTQLKYKQDDMWAMWECARLLGRIQQAHTDMYTIMLHSRGKEINELKTIVSELTAEDLEPLPFE